jgi:hypothetical protein
MLTGPPNHWTKEQVAVHVFEKWAKDRFPFAKPFDPLSIMGWSFPAEFTSGEQIFHRNVARSPGDKEFVTRLYPYPGDGKAEAPSAKPGHKRRLSPATRSRTRKRR